MSLELFLRGVGWTLVGYALAGASFAALLQVRGLHALDPGTRGTSVAFRLVLLPGMIALWPLLAWRWKQGSVASGFHPAADLAATPRRLRTGHRLAWKTLVVLGPLLLALALIQRPPPLPVTPELPGVGVSTPPSHPLKESGSPATAATHH